MARRRRGGRKHRGKAAVPSNRLGKPRVKKGSLPFNVKITQALTKMHRNQKLVFRDLKEEIAFENISRIALGGQTGRLGEKEWKIVHNILERNKYKR